MCARSPVESQRVYLKDTAMSGTLCARIDVALKARGTKTALMAGGTKITGQDLRDRAREAANALRISGAEPGDTVGILTDRSADALVAILGVLYLGCAYLPVDRATP